MSRVKVIFVYPIIRTDFIDKSLETLYKFTDPETFRVIVVDQSMKGWSSPWSQRVFDHNGMIISMRNQGFAKAANEGLIHGLRWQVPYLAVVNDDVEFIYPQWFPDLLKEFDTDPHIIAVNPECPKVAMWGYGLTNGEYVEILPYKEHYAPEDIAYLKSGDYNEQEIRGRHPFKIPESFPFRKRGVIDGFAGWLPVFKREGLIEKGLYEERFVWGGGEDYDMMGRAYSCAWPVPRKICDPKYHRRMVSSMKSWVWHHWGQSKDRAAELDPRLFQGRESWNRLDDLWMPYCDPWGHTRDSDHKPLQRDTELHIHIP